MRIELKVLDKHFYEEYSLPTYATQGSAGLDLSITKDIILLPNMTKLCGTGLAIWIGSSADYSLAYHSGISHRLPDNFRQEPIQVAGLIIPRSGTGHKRGIILGNGTGLIDESYQGELVLSIWNRSELVQEIKAGERIGQLVFIPVLQAEFKLVEEFSNLTERNVQGWGHSGV